jgi:hypothetical protein
MPCGCTLAVRSAPGRKNASSARTSHLRGNALHHTGKRLAWPHFEEGVTPVGYGIVHGVFPAHWGTHLLHQKVLYRCGGRMRGGGHIR